jgi:hypothetical protein
MAGTDRGGRLARALWAAALGIGLALGSAQGAFAQTAGLEQLGRWYLAEVGWRDRGTLPSDNELAAPLIAQYNWAYGAIAMGLNVRARGTSSYYAAVALNDNAQLDVLDSFGPVSGPVLWDAGKYHLAAGLPNGQLVVWLCAPGAMPRRVVLTDSYTPGTGFDLAVYPPDPVSRTWESWVISAAYQYSQGDPGLLVESFHGDGSSLDFTSTLGTPGNLVSVQYADYPASAGGSTPYVAFTCERDNQPSPGNNAHTGLLTAWYSSSEGRWVPANFRNTGLYLGNTSLGWGGANGTATVLAAFDESDQSGLYGGLQLLTTSINRHGQVASTAHSACWLPCAPRRDNFCFLDSARLAGPFTVLSDGLDVFFGWRVQAANGGQGLEYYHLRLHQGERAQQGTGTQARFPILGVAAAAHWSSGDPSLYWIQRGNSSGETGGVLYQLVYWAGAK